jgi:hypothetical protein
MKNFVFALFTQYYNGEQIQQDEMGEERSMKGDMRYARKFLVANPERKRQLGRSMRREDNIKMDVIRTGCEDVELDRNG